MRVKQRISSEERREPKEERRRYLAERLLDSRTILLTDEISREMAEDVVTKLLLLDQAERAPIYLYLNSPGGDVDGGFAIYDMTKFVTSPVTCVCTGLTASAAVLVLLAASKSRRFSLANSRFLLHQPSGGVRGTTTDVQIEADEILKIRKRINKLIADETGQPLEKVERDTHRNFWMDAAQAKEYGLISKIVKSKSEIEK